MSSSTPPAIRPLPRQRGWFERNWKWLLPTFIVGALLVFAAFVALIVGIVFASLKSSDAYKLPVATATADARVQAALGTPVEPGFFVTGNIHITGTSGNADLSIPISGPKDKGTIYVVGSKSAGLWTFSTLVVEVNSTRQRIDLSTNATGTKLQSN